jgi:hypothetical protein
MQSETEKTQAQPAQKIRVQPEDAQIYPEQHLTGKILEAAFAVHNSLGAGFVEKVYENALVIELKEMNINCE